MTETEKRLRIALLKVELLERGVHPIAVRGLVADEKVARRIGEDDDAGAPVVDVPTLATEVLKDVPLSMYKDAESAEDWAARMYGGEGTAEDYLKTRYVRPSELRKQAAGK